jgi:hypothetical protein
MLRAPPRSAYGHLTGLPDGARQYATPRKIAGVCAMPLPELMYRHFSQLRDTTNVSELVPSDAAKLVLDGSHTLLEPDWRDRVAK